MVAKSIIEISVDDSQFREFNSLFQKYQKQLSGMPEDWKKVVDVIGEGGDEMGGFAKSSKSSKEFLMIAAIQADAISKAMARATGVQDKFNTKAKDGAIQMNRMSKFSKEMHKSIAGMSTILLKLGTAGVGGIGSAIGAVYGATSQLAGRNLQARGLGLKIGQTQAFDANFEKFGLSTSDLTNVSNSQSDVSKWRAFTAAGLTPDQIQNEDAEQLTFDFAKKASGKYREWQKAGMPAASMAQAYGFTDVLSLQQLRTGASYSDSDWQRAQEKEIEDAKKNAVNQGTADQASDVKAALKSDWAEVINAFDNQLAQAAGPLQKLGDAAAAAAISLLNVAGPQAKSVLDAVTGAPVPRADAQKSNTLAGALARLGYNMRDLSTLGSIKSGQDAPVFKWDWHHPFGSFGRSAQPAAQDQGGALSPQMAAMIDAQYQTESRRGKDLISKKGALGPMQFMPDTWSEWGHGDVNNLKDSANAAARYDAFLMKKYGGDVRKTLAAYNWGMGNVDKDINGYTDRQGSFHQGHGANWENYSPKETQKYIKDNINIMITNSTTANVATSMNAAPH